MLTLISGIFYLIILICLASSDNPPMLQTNETSREMVVSPHETVNMDCPVRRNRKNMFEWYKEKSQMIEFPDERFKILSNGVLKIKDVTYSDTGVYRCRAINGYGSVEFNTTLLVIGSEGYEKDYHDYDYGYSQEILPEGDSKISLTYKPRILRVSDKVSPIIKKVGETFKLQCVATGLPAPEMIWYKDGIKINSAKTGKWALPFTEAILTDSGNYTCVAKNILGKDSHSFFLIIDPFGSALQLKPILSGGNITIVEEGEKAVMECSVESFPLLHIEWLKQVDKENPDEETEESPIMMQGEFFNVVDNEHQVETIRDGNMHYHRLLIENAQLRDAGKYVCLGANTRGYEYRFAFLEVKRKGVRFETSFDFTIIVTVLTISVVVLVGIFSCLMYCNPRKRPAQGMKDAISKDEAIPMQPQPSLPLGNHQTSLMPSGVFGNFVEDNSSMIFIEYGPPNTPVEYNRHNGTRKHGKKKKNSHELNPYRLCPNNLSVV
ncbi:fibroblast growth factor receptor-like 1 [Parasteatoda tepidariorum]|uniref:fibroblast growth factor receptor-like 1 n=1 Tax=Parasteatoda tepidariorum TaxID=114398 RepID=UPI00077FC8CC|nr:fibroblast growth factor receptor-like 1 [Parasteatoda tepidariorum]